METRAHRIAVIILNYRTPQLVVDCLESLVPQVDLARDAVVVVDNASGDESVPMLRTALATRGWDSVRLVESPRNGGFAAGNNFGIRAVDAEAYFLLNSDTLVRRGALELLWRALTSDPVIGLVGPRIESADGTPQVSCFRFHTPWSELIAAARTGLIQRLLSRWDVPLPLTEEPIAPEWISFAAVLIRREAIARVGPLDEGYFMYFEDVDYCRRAREAGFEIRYEPRARVVHFEGSSTGFSPGTRGRERRPRYYYASRSRYLRKAQGGAGLLAANSLWTVGRAISWLREVSGSKPADSVERELVDLWRG